MWAASLTYGQNSGVEISEKTREAALAELAKNFVFYCDMRGYTTTRNVRLYQYCEACHGDGERPRKNQPYAPKVRCTACKGKGVLSSSDRPSMAEMEEAISVERALLYNATCGELGIKATSEIALIIAGKSMGWRDGRQRFYLGNR